MHDQSTWAESLRFWCKVDLNHTPLICKFLYCSLPFQVRSINTSRVIVNNSRVIMTGTKNMEVTTSATNPGRWSNCDCCRQMHSSGKEGHEAVNVSFAGCGFLGIYHIGVMRCFLTHGKHMLHRVKRWGGASAGALAAASIVCIPNKLDVSISIGFFFVFFFLERGIFFSFLFLERGVRKVGNLCFFRIFYF